MPSSGYPMVNLSTHDSDHENLICMRTITADAKVAMDHGLFIEWMESFIGAYNAGAKPCHASAAGRTEWDF